MLKSKDFDYLYADERQETDCIFQNSLLFIQDFFFSSEKLFLHFLSCLSLIRLMEAQ